MHPNTRSPCGPAWTMTWTLWQFPKSDNWRRYLTSWIAPKKSKMHRLDSWNRYNSNGSECSCDLVFSWKDNGHSAYLINQVKGIIFAILSHTKNHHLFKTMTIWQKIKCLPTPYSSNLSKLSFVIIIHVCFIDYSWYRLNTKHSQNKGKAV